MSDTAAVTFTHKRVGKNGSATISVKVGGDVLAVQKVDLSNPSCRDQFADDLVEKFPGLDHESVQTELLAIADEIVGDDAQGDKARETQADKLVKLAEGLNLFHTPGGADADCFATFEANEGRETWALNSKAFRHYLSGRFYQAYEKAPGSQAIQDALGVLNFKAMHEGEERAVHLRIAEHEGNIWLDLTDSEWRAIEISSTGWRVVDSKNVPLRFIRRRAMLPLPMPVAGGNIDELRGLLNLPGDAEWKLFVAWLVMAFRPSGPYPILVVGGEQGSAKSTICRFARALIDPNQSPVRRPPKNEQDLMIAASNSWTLAFDNLSGISPSLSDALCALATGGGFATRQLFSDGDEKIIDATRPVMVNGIDDLATRADLMDRAVSIKLPVISEASRREESELNAKFEEARPRILGAFLSAVSSALRNYPSTNLPLKPRMADFARWVTSAESALGWEPGSFLDVYAGNREEANVSVIENSLIGPILVNLVKEKAEWRGSTGELLKELNAITEEKTTNLKLWPRSVQALTGKLRRLAPSLRAVGVNITWEPRTKQGRILQLDWVGNTTSPTSPTSPNTTQVIENKRVETGDVGHGKGDVPPEQPATHVTDTNTNDTNSLGNIGDVGDVHSPTLSKATSSDPNQEQFQL